MPPLVMPQTVRVRHIYQVGGLDYAVNVMHYVVPASQVVTGATATDYAADVNGAINLSSIDAEWSDQVTLDRVTVRDLRTANLPEFAAQVNRDGLDIEPPIPPMSSLVVTLRTAKAGRSFRGRVYLPGWSEGTNVLTGVASTAAQQASLAFIQDLMSVVVEGNTWSLGVASITLGEINAVTSAEVRDAVWDTQRRRSIPGI